ncbi:MAG: SMI1/KNR4 family protein [Synechococcaceae cyanobacterium SM2_3_1]|nr:SMI1/KNR4 family protein [Synechococcaceae cyanobacterium SM2_3_1]
MHLERIKSIYHNSPLASQEVFACSPEEVALLEKKLDLGYPLPEIYKEFLLWMGKGAGSLLKDCDFFYQDLMMRGEFDMQKLPEELLAECNCPLHMPNDGFVFYSRLGAKFAFLRLSEGNESPVYYFSEEFESFESYFPRTDTPALGEGETIKTMKSFPIYKFRNKSCKFDHFLALKINGYSKYLMKDSERRDLPDFLAYWESQFQ